LLERYLVGKIRKLNFLEFAERCEVLINSARTLDIYNMNE